ncbi:MAG: permease-like cell division protein FtsX [Oscillospiraceae bacterium]|nr:permease-like cell division protein FtsX [Oscillospiraceae bacterium]
MSRGSYLIREGFRSIKTHGLMSFATVTIIMACLIIMGSVALLSLNINYLIKDLEKQNEVVAFVDDEIEDEEEAKAIGSQILAVGNISAADFVSRSEAMQNYMSKYDKSLMEGIDETVFRHRFIIHLNDIEKLAQTKEALEGVPGIARVRAHQEYADTFVKIRNIVSGVALVLMAILVFVSMFIMSNTIKLATFSRREEIAIMKMVGASNGFIRLPFVVEGLVLGLLGGGLGFLAQWGLYNLVTRSLMESITGDILEVVPFLSIAPLILVVYLGIGVVIGVFGGVNAIKNYLKV